MNGHRPRPLPSMTSTLQTLRVPKGLWADLEETVIQQDRQFLTEVARSLGLPVAEVLKKCLGTGATQTIAVLIGSPTEEFGACPWWTRSEDGLWKPCLRSRLTPTTACQFHLHAATGPSSCLGSDALLDTLPTVKPMRFAQRIYWVSDGPDTCVYREDGMIESELVFKYIQHRGQRIGVAVDHS